jgi:hypothetical protein
MLSRPPSSDTTMANDQETPPPSTPGEKRLSSPSLAALEAIRRQEPTALWPANVPLQDKALEVLRGELKLAASLPGARKIQESLTQPERESLHPDSPAEALREALCVRWRLAAAQDLRPNSDGKVDPAALNALLADADRALDALQAVTAPTTELALAIDRTCETLTQEAIDFTSQARAPAPAPAPAPPRKSVTTPAVPAPKVTFQAEEPHQSRPKWLIPALLALVVLGAGGYHLSNRPQEQVQESGYPGAPTNTLVVSDPSTGTLVIRSTRKGPLSEQQQAWLKQLESQGMEVKQAGMTFFATPGNKTPATASPTPP